MSTEEQTNEQATNNEPAETQEEIHEHFDVYEFLGINDKDEYETVCQKVQEKLGISVSDMQVRLSQSTLARAEELTLDLPNIAPLGNYERLIEDNDGMAEFIKTEAHKSEHWKLYSIREHYDNNKILTFRFFNDAVDQGESITGLVYVSKSGKIRHVFPKVES